MLWQKYKFILPESDTIHFSDDNDRPGVRFGARVFGAISTSDDYHPAVSKMHVDILSFEISPRNPFISSSGSPSLYGSPLFIGSRGWRPHIGCSYSDSHSPHHLLSEFFDPPFLFFDELPLSGLVFGIPILETGTALRLTTHPPSPMRLLDPLLLPHTLSLSNTLASPLHENYLPRVRGRHLSPLILRVWVISVRAVVISPLY